MNKKGLLKKICEKILSEIYPENLKCIFCGEDVFGEDCVCENCKKVLPYNNKRICSRCGTPIHSLASHCSYCKEMPYNFKKARSPFVYAPPISDAIRKLKYSSAKYLAKPLADFLVNEYILDGFSCDIVVPVPLFLKREKERGYNQSFLISEAVALKLGLPIVTDSLVRTKETPTQTLLTRKEREKNLEEAFEVKNKINIKGKTVLLIDDVFTTGATMDYCSLALADAGTKEIFCLTIAHTDFGKHKKK
ncbi:MAG: ComF family protein [Clostridia bacterium]